MDAGQESNSQPSAIERAVLAAENRVPIRRRWYQHRGVWGFCGICIGLAAGVPIGQLVPGQKQVVYQSVPVPVSNSAAQQMTRVEPKMAPKVEPKIAKKDGVQSDASEILNQQMPAIPADLPRMPMPSSEFRELPRTIGDVSAVQPEIEVAPIEKPTVKAAPSPQEEANKRKRKELIERIATLQAQKDELLKSFYEDAIPVKHLTEDIAKAEAELKEVGAKK
jgi:hypothetical protein